jgi:RNA polymerase sigma-54 factor
MSLGMELRLRQHLAVTPLLQQALRLLQLSSLEFTEEVQQALANNPFLEEEGDPAAAAKPATAAGDAADAGLADAPSAPAAETGVAADSAVSVGDGDERGDTGNQTGDDSDWSAGESYEGYEGGDSYSGDAGDEDNDWTTWSEAPVGLHEQLRQQLLLFPLSDRDRALTNLVIDELTDAGYLETPLDELAALIPAEYEVEPQEILAALKLVQQLEPVGIAARSLQECLQLQLAALPAETPGRPVALALVGEQFDLLAKRDFAHLQQRLGCDETALHTARALIRKLDPKPGQRFSGEDTRYVVPDILVNKVRGQWGCTVNPAIQPRLRINRAYARIAAHRGSCAASFAGQLQEARWFLRNIEQRFSTILRVATSIVSRQKAFFNYGDAAMKPLILKDIAAELGLHESTVCRVTNGKYMATPRGLFEFKHFFSRQLAMEDGGACSALAIRALMKELIAAEDPQHPLSDAQLTRLLADQGLRLARRTVTKYRTLMRVPSIELRRVGKMAGAGTPLATT